MNRGYLMSTFHLTRLRRIFGASVLAACTATAASAADRAIIVMDASGSMWGQIDGKTKIEIARETMGGVLGSLPAELELGLIAYGHRDKGLCSDIEEIVAPAAGNRQAIADAVNKLNPKGKTPLTDAVRQAAQSLRYTEDKATVILVTDGIETCEADPCAVATELEAAGVDFTAHVVGFGLTEEEGQKVACLAENTGGKFIQAKDASELGAALTEVAAAPAPAPEPAPEPVAVTENVKVAVFLAPGVPIARDAFIEFKAVDASGNLAERSAWYGYETKPVVRFVEPGKYRLTVRQDRVEVNEDIELTADAVTEREIVLNAGEITLFVAPDEGAKPDDRAYVEVANGDVRDYGYGSVRAVMPAGELTLTGKIGEAEVKETFALAAGQQVEHTLVAAAGRVTMTAVYADGGPKVEDGSLYMEILSGKKKLDGSRDNFGYGYGATGDHMVPPGDYVVVAKLGAAKAEVPVTVEANALSEVVININAGVLAVKVPGANSIEIVDAKPDLAGNRKSYFFSYTDDMQETLPPGDYMVVAKFEGDRAPVEKTVTVKLAERTEETIE